FSENQVAEARAVLEASERFATPALLDQATHTARDLAAYDDRLPVDGARAMLEAIDDLDDPMPIFERFGDVEPRDVQSIIAAAGSDPARAVALLIQQLNHELAWRDPILLGRPTIKMPDLGMSLRGRPVLDLLAQAVPITLLL